MIARFTFALSAPLSVRPVDDLQPLSISHDGISYRIFPPQQAPQFGAGVAGKHGPVIDVLIVDEQETYLADTLCIDVMGDFDRREGQVGPEYKSALAVAGRLISLFRTLARAPFVFPPDEQSAWRVRYLKDDETEFDRMDGFVRGRGRATTGKLSRSWVAPEIWQSLAISHNAQPPSDGLMLDALNLWPHIGASIVLAYTAIEVRISTALDLLVGRSIRAVDAAVWTWINDRGNSLKEPSVEEQLSDLLDMLSGRSLKRESVLWRAYSDLRKARNSFAHEGKSTLPGGSIVTPEKALELISSAQEILQWIEAGLLPTERTPSVALPQRTLGFTISIVPQ
jgi:hypothetical protein